MRFYHLAGLAMAGGAAVAAFAADPGGAAGLWSRANASPPLCVEGPEGALSITRARIDMGEAHCRFHARQKPGFAAYKGRVACEVEGSAMESRVALRRDGADLLLSFDGGPMTRYRRCPAPGAGR